MYVGFSVTRECTYKQMILRLCLSRMCHSFQELGTLETWSGIGHGIDTVIVSSEFYGRALGEWQQRPTDVRVTRDAHCYQEDRFTRSET